MQYKDELEKLALLRPCLTGSLLLTTYAADSDHESVHDFSFPTSCTKFLRRVKFKF